MKKKIITVLGDFYHEHNLIFEALSTALRSLGTEFEIRDVSIGEMPKFLQDKPDLVILFKEDRLNPQDAVVKGWMTHKIEQLIVEYVTDGGSWMAWHAGLASYPEGGLYNTMLRGYFKYHPSENKMVRYYPADSSAILRKDAVFDAIDEHYFVECDSANTDVFLFSESVDGKSAAGWTHEYGKGRVCCLTPAHRAEGLMNPVMGEILLKVVQWGCRIV